MSDDKRQSPRVDVNVPVQVSGGADNLPGTITNLSDSGAALEFVPELGKQDVSFEIGNAVSIDSDQTDHVSGSVVRQYEGGIAMQFSVENKDVLRHISDIVDDELSRKEK